MQRRIGLYGGTFDPVHKGHVSLVRSFLNSGHIDLIWILLTPDPPHKEHSNITDFSHRKSMLQLAFASFKNIEILDIEIELPKPSFTYQTVEYLVRKNQNTSFLYCMGSDSLTNLHKWKHPKLILNYVDLLVAKRPGFEITSIDQTFLDKTTLIDHHPLDISSTNIKMSLKSNKSIKGLVHTDVENYIKTHHLYN